MIGISKNWRRGEFCHPKGVALKCYLLRYDPLAFSCVAFGISAARSSLGVEAYNCVVENCTVSDPAGATSVGVIGIHLGTIETDVFHRHCVIRDCFVDMGPGGTADFTKSFLAISAGEGIGTIVENNQIRNSLFGLSWGDTLCSPG